MSFFIEGLLAIEVFTFQVIGLGSSLLFLGLHVPSHALNFVGLGVAFPFGVGIVIEPGKPVQASLPHGFIYLANLGME